MISDPDIFRAAQLLIEQHGADAAIRAAQRVDSLADGGDLDGGDSLAPDPGSDQ